ncbi:unnamed protein product [Linum tenue]|uniref:Pentatricopeptide repeat-containing protein n=1 Tax=Linum tenue TaxID=586396 RepID=A0AAV0J3N1_9ROSI|nr:unnamed protein product [Linum tenue]
MATSVATLDHPPPSFATLPTDRKSLSFELADNLLSRGLYSSAQQVIQRIISSSTTLADAISAADFAAGRGVELSLHCYYVLIRRVMGFGDFQFARAIYFHGIVDRGLEPDSNIVNSVIVCLAKLGDLEGALVLFDRLWDKGWMPCEAAGDTVLRGLYEQKRFLEALVYFTRITNLKVHVGFWCFNILIDGLCKQGHLVEALKVFDVMRDRTGLPPTVHLLKSLFFGFCKKGICVDAERVCREMEEHGFFVDAVMYSSLINAYCKHNDLRMAIMVFFRMLKMGCEPDKYTYTTLIQGFLKMGYPDKGLIMYNQMLDLGMQPDLVTAQSIISGYCQNGKVDSAMEFLDSMARSSLVPSVHNYTSLLSALYKQNRFSNAKVLFRNMLDRGVIPDHVTFLILMKNLPKGQELELAFFILRAIARNGCRLDPCLLSVSPEICSTVDLQYEIEIILLEIVRSNCNLANVSFGIYISALCESGKFEAALASFETLRGLGCRPLPFTFNSLIKGLCKHGLRQEVKYLLGIMQKHEIVPDFATFLILVREFCTQNDLTSAFDVLDEMKQCGIKPTVAIYDCIIGCLTKGGKMSEAETWFMKMIETGLDPDEMICVTMINGYFRNKQSQKALSLFDVMVKNGIQPTRFSYNALMKGLVKNKMAPCALTAVMRAHDGPSISMWASLAHFLSPWIRMQSDYYVVSSALYVNETVWQRVTGVAILHYSNSHGPAASPLPEAANDIYY